MSKLIDIQGFATKQGHQDRITLEASLPFHTAYSKAEPAQQKDLKARYLTGYVSGYLDVTPEKADVIVSLTRVERTEKGAKYEKAVNAASFQFRRHIVRTMPVKPSNHTPVTRNALALAKSYLSNFDSYSAALTALQAAK